MKTFRVHYYKQINTDLVGNGVEHSTIVVEASTIEEAKTNAESLLKGWGVNPKITTAEEITNE